MTRLSISGSTQPEELDRGAAGVIDVDVRFDWMSRLERQIMNDSIEPQEEKQLLKGYPGFTETRLDFILPSFYELVEVYRHFLLIRIRHAHHKWQMIFRLPFKNTKTKLRAGAHTRGDSGYCQLSI